MNWERHTSVGDVARVYDIENVHDWGRQEANGLLLSNGAGAMLSAMDTLPWLRWAWDVSGVRDPLSYKMTAFAEIAGRLADPIACVLVFWTDDPAPIRTLLACMPSWKIASYSNRPMGDNIIEVGNHAALARALSIGVWAQRLQRAQDAAT